MQQKKAIAPIQNQDTAKPSDIWVRPDPELTPPSIIPKEIAWPSQREVAKLTELAIANKNTENLLREKFDLTVPTNEELQDIADKSLVLLKLLQIPQQPSQITKLNKTSLKPWETSLDDFFTTYGKSLQSATRWVRGVCKEGQFETAFGAVQEWREEGIFKLDTILYNSLLSGLTGVPYEQVNEKAHLILNMMKEDKVKPDHISFGSIIYPLVKKKPLSTLELDAAFAWMNEIKAYNIEPTVPIFTNLVVGCVRAGDANRAWATFDHMRVWRCQPDFVMYTEMMHVCSMTGEAEKALNLYQEMREEDLYPTEVTYTALLSSFRKRPDMFREGIHVLGEMKLAGFKPDIRTWKAVIEMISGGGDVKTSELVFDEAMREFASPDNVFPKEQYLMSFYAETLRAYAQSFRSIAVRKDTKLIESNIKQAETIFNKLIEAGETPNLAVANGMLSVYASGIRLNRALAFREEFAKYGLQPSVETYNILVRMYSRARRLERAFDIFNQMKLLGMKPNLTTYSDLITACARSDFVMSGMRLLREMKAKGIQCEPHHYYVINFRRNLTTSPHLIREIDEITGKNLHFVPGWKKVGGRKARPEYRDVSKEEKKRIDREPVFLTPEQVRPQKFQ